MAGVLYEVPYVRMECGRLGARGHFEVLGTGEIFTYIGVEEGWVGIKTA